MRFTVIAAITIDGKIAKHENHLTDWTSKEDKEFMHSELDKCDVIVVGNNTYKTAEKQLSKRKCIVITRSVKNIEKKNKNITYLNPDNMNILEYIKNNNYKTQETRSVSGRKNGKTVFREIIILGGTQTYSYFLKKDLIDEMYITVEPIIFGAGLSLFDCGIDYKRYRLISTKQLNNKGTVLLHYTK